MGKAIVIGMNDKSIAKHIGRVEKKLISVNVDKAARYGDLCKSGSALLKGANGTLALVKISAPNGRYIEKIPCAA